MSGERTETEYVLMVDYLGRDGIFGSERRFIGTVPENAVLEEARALINDHADRVEVWSREVPIEWTKVEELRTERVPRKGSGA